MVQPNVIKRKLTGVGGNRFFDIPGVVYPDEVLKVKPGHCPKDGLPYKTPPKWGITTEQAGKLLGCSPSAARIMLRRKKVIFQLVSCATSPPVTYWKKSRVERIAAEKLPLVSEESIAHLLTTEEAAELLHVGRSTIQRALRNKILTPVHVRVNSPQGPRKRSFLRRGELKKWGMHLQAKRLRELEKSQEIIDNIDD